jgi:hypothetical protein
VCRFGGGHRGGRLSTRVNRNWVGSRQRRAQRTGCVAAKTETGVMLKLRASSIYPERWRGASGRARATCCSLTKPGGALERTQAL